jgi:hypothetical protein
MGYRAQAEGLDFERRATSSNYNSILKNSEDAGFCSEKGFHLVTVFLKMDRRKALQPRGDNEEI